MGATGGVAISGPMNQRFDQILTDDALALIADLHRRYEPRRRELLAERGRRQERISAGADLDFLPETRSVREDPSWTVSPPAPASPTAGSKSPGPPTRR